MDPQPLSVPFGATILHGDVIGDRPSVLCLHGAGQSDRGRFSALRSVLADRGISSATFDFVGHGVTGGDLAASSLAQRTAQAEAVINAVSFTPPFAVMGSSMSGYTAIKLTATQPIDKLILIVPGVYAADAYTLPFNGGFTERIRQPASWQDSDAFDLLANFPGWTLIIDAGQDAVVPSDLTDQLAAASPRLERLTVAGAQHGIVNYLAQHPAEQASVYAAIAEFLER